MKIFCMNVIFRLPDEFEGTKSDALSLLAGYDRTAPFVRAGVEFTEEDSAILDKAQALVYDKFLEDTKDGLSRYSARYSIQRLNEDAQKWERMDGE